MLDTTGSEAGNDEGSASESLLLFCCLLWRRLDGVSLVFKLKTTIKDHMERGAEQILQINNTFGFKDCLYANFQHIESN